MYIALRTRLRTPLRVYGKIPRENARVGHARGHGCGDMDRRLYSLFPFYKQLLRHVLVHELFWGKIHNLQCPTKIYSRQRISR